MNRLLLLFIFFSQIIHGQYWYPDTSFGNSGKVINTSSTYLATRIFFENNKYIVVQNLNEVISYNYDGTINTLFGVNGKTSLVFNSNLIEVKNAKIVNNSLYVFGRYGASNYTCVLYKMSLDGQLDSSFGTNGRVIIDFGSTSDALNDVAVLPNGSIFGLGYNNSNVVIAKWNSSGVLDTNFNGTGLKTFYFNNSTEIASGASIHISGNEFYIIGISRFQNFKYLSVAKVDLNMDPVTTFGTNGLLNQVLGNPTDITSYTLRGSNLINNEMLYFTLFEASSFSSQDHYLGKLNINTGTFIKHFIYLPYSNPCFEVLSDNSIYTSGFDRCSGSSGNCDRDYLIYKKTPTGVADLTYNQTGMFSYDFFPSDAVSDDVSTAFYVHNDGKIVIGGKIYNPFTTGGSGMTLLRIVESPLSNSNLTQAQFTVFPNPVKDFFFIQNKENESVNEVRILNPLGNCVIALHSVDSNSVDISHLNPGVYFVYIKTNSNAEFVKIIKN